MTDAAPYSFSFNFDKDTYDVLGPDRVEAIRRVANFSVQNQAWNSYWVAMSGALRHPVCLRPEVVLDATGRLL